MKKIIVGVSILVVLIVAFFGARLIFTEKVNVALKWKHQAQFAGMYTALETKMYQFKGLDVQLNEFDFTTTPSEQLLNGEVEFALLSAEEFIVHIDNGEDIFAVAAIYQISPYAFVSLKEKGITNPADYLDKVLGTKGGKLEQKLAYAILLENFGIDLDQVDLKTLGFDKREIDNLIDGDADVVDLYRTDQLYHFDNEGIEYDTVFLDRYGAHVNNDIIVTRRSYFEENPKIVKRFVKATINGWAKALDNPEKAVTHTLKYVTDASYNDAEYQKYILENSAPLIKPTTSTQLGQVNPVQMKNAYDALLKNEFIATEFNISNHYTNELLPN